MECSCSVVTSGEDELSGGVHELGLLLGIRNINSYTSRVEEDSPFKAPIRKMFEKVDLPWP